MTLCSQIVDFIWLDLAHQTDQAGRIGQVAVVQLDGILFNQMIDTGGIGDRSATDNAVDFIALLQKELSQIGAILTGDTSNQRNFRHILTSNFPVVLCSPLLCFHDHFNELNSKTEFTILLFGPILLHDIAFFFQKAAALLQLPE